MLYINRCSFSFTQHTYMTFNTYHSVFNLLQSNLQLELSITLRHKWPKNHYNTAIVTPGGRYTCEHYIWTPNVTLWLSIVTERKVLQYGPTVILYGPIVTFVNVTLGYNYFVEVGPT